MSVHDILESAYLGTLTKLGEIQTILKVDNETAAQICFVSPETYRRWRSDRKPNKCAMKLLGILAGYVPWPGWEKFFYNPHDQMLYSQELKYGFSPGDLHTLHYLKLGFEQLQRENTELRERLKDVENLLASPADLDTASNVVLFPNLREIPQPQSLDTRQPETPVKTIKQQWLKDTFTGFIKRMVG